MTDRIAFKSSGAVPPQFRNRRVVPSFDVSSADAKLIRAIVDRAVRALSAHGAKPDKLSLSMDVTATHANGCPLRLDALLHADDFNLLHDVCGISHNINRDTGELRNCFRPRFACPKAA